MKQLLEQKACSKNFPALLEPEGSAPRSQKPANGLYFKSHEPSPHPPNWLL
jgi:hypothetical protein